MNSDVVTLPPAYDRGPLLQQLEERTVTDLEPQRVQGHRTPVVDRTVEDVVRTRVGDHERPERVVGRDRRDVVVDLLRGPSALVLGPEPLHVRREALVEPDVAPAVHGEAVTGPLVGQLVGHHRVVLHAAGLEEVLAAARRAPRRGPRRPSSRRRCPCTPPGSRPRRRRCRGTRCRPSPHAGRRRVKVLRAATGCTRGQLRAATSSATPGCPCRPTTYDARAHRPGDQARTVPARVDRALAGHPHLLAEVLLLLGVVVVAVDLLAPARPSTPTHSAKQATTRSIISSRLSSANSCAHRSSRM